MLRHLPQPGEPDADADPSAAYSDLDEWFATLHEVGSRETDQAL